MSLHAERRHQRERDRQQRYRDAATRLRTYARREAARDALVTTRVELLVAVAELLDLWAYGAPLPGRAGPMALDALLRAIEALPEPGTLQRGRSAMRSEGRRY